MTRSARVRAIDAVDAVGVALRRFQEETTAALDELQLEIHRALEWIGSDLPHHWKAAERRAWDDLGAARVQLEQARTTKRIAEHDPACREEKKALQRAQQRLETVHARQTSLREWNHVVEKAVNEYRARSRQLSGWLETDLPRGLAALKQMATALESYLAVQPVADRRAMLPTTGGEDAAAPEPAAPTSPVTETSVAEAPVAEAPAGPPPHPEAQP